ncbi:hypothetical protein MTX78_12170 [Hymenobacter tibetensis]|uniref:Lipocalin-like domain-containing protein n=1 Tax=Hymenobacter tibetensis TaxID=497967 RepID=A0ABY4CV48_9BACT|nr:hypothetical protein [Hymenobacter tibetensis]UOG72884.1 hypothetical protein MTX78_12170 [Hymenobacter tibetensis]
MKKVLLLSLSLASLVSCQKEDSAEFKVGAYPQTWQLVKSTSSWTNTVVTGANLPYQEKYVFQADSTFTKTRQEGDQTTEASGTFSVRTFSDGQYATLTYPEASNLIGSCTTISLKEHLALKSNDTIRNTWEACDGPRLEYKRVN